MANIEELRSGSLSGPGASLEQEEAQRGPELSVAHWTDQLGRLEETSSLMATEGFPQMVLEGFNKEWTNFKAVTQNSRDKIATINQTVQLRLEAGVASRADLERKYRELEDLEEEYRALRTRSSTSRMEGRQ